MDVSTPTSAPKILAISVSLKQSHSASRALLDLASDLLGRVYPNLEKIDLADYEFPAFAGLDPRAHPHAVVREVRDRLDEAQGLLISVPCYWSTVSGVFKNFVDVVCGAAYDLVLPDTVFSGKSIGLIVVGADDESTAHGARDARRILASAGASVIEDVVAVSNPRNAPLPPSTRTDLARLVGSLAKQVLGGARDA